MALGDTLGSEPDGIASFIDRQIAAATRSTSTERGKDSVTLAQVNSQPFQSYIDNLKDGRPRLLHIAHSPFSAGGVERSTQQLLSGLSLTFNQLYITPGKLPDAATSFYQARLVPFAHLVFNRKRIQPSFRVAGFGADLSCTSSEAELARAITFFNPQIVHIHHLHHWDTLLLPLIANALGCKVVISFHDLHMMCPVHNQLEAHSGHPCGRQRCQPDSRCLQCLSRYANAAQSNLPQYITARHAINARALDACSGLVVPSQFLKHKATLAFPALAEDKIHVVPHGVITPKSTPKNTPKRTRNPEVLQVGFFGGANPMKGIETVLSIAQELAAHPVRFYLYGNCADLTVNGNATIVIGGAYQPHQIPALQSKLDLVLIPSNCEESFSMVLSEAWASGVPVLASSRGALRNRIIEGKNGWTEHSQDPTRWAQTITKLMPPSRRRAAQRWMRANPPSNVRNQCRQYQSLYETLDNHDQRYRTDTQPSGRKPSLFGLMRDHWATPHYRIKYPLQALFQAGITERPSFAIAKESGLNIFPTLAKSGCSQILMQPFLSDSGLDLMESIVHTGVAELVLVIDDLWTSTPENTAANPFTNEEKGQRLSYAADLSDRVILTTPALESATSFIHPQLSVINNGLPLEQWPKPQRPRTRHRGQRLRVGWAGAFRHEEDLTLLERVIKTTCDQMDWVVLGRCPRNLQPSISDLRSPVPFTEFPAALSNLDLDIAVAPLRSTPFNRCKSHLKLLEYGAMGWPVIASDIAPYRNSPATLCDSNPQSWLAAIDHLSASADARNDGGVQMRKWVTQSQSMELRQPDWAKALGLNEH
ncbi:MAG: glycosyltransferase [Lysobacterales bacterium]